MTETTLRIRPQAVSDYLHYRYRIQPGQALCLVLNQPAARDNYQALAAWVRESLEALEASHGLDPVKQVECIEYELCEHLVDSGLAAGPIDGYEVPALVLGRLYETVPVRRSDHPGRSYHRSPPRPSANVIRFPKK